MTDKSDLELAAFHAANKRNAGLRYAPMVFATEKGLLLLEWDRMQWRANWLPDPQPLKAA